MPSDSPSVRCVVFTLSESAPLSWIPLSEGGSWANVVVERRKEDSMVHDIKVTAEEGGSNELQLVIDISLHFEWIAVQPDFFEGYSHATKRRVGIYCVDASEGARLNDAVHGALEAVVAAHTLALPPPSRLAHRATLLYNEEYARYESLPTAWKDLNCQFGRSYKLLHRSTVSGYPCGVATVLVVLKNQLFKNRGLETDGLFRAAADVEGLNAIKEEINTGVFRGCDDPHVAANLIKMFFRELPEKLLDVYTAARLDLKADFVGRSAIETMQRVQEPYRSLLFWLLDLAVDVALFEECNQMNPKCLSVVFAPNLISTSIDERAFIETQQAIHVLESLIRERMAQSTNGKSCH